MFVLRLLLLPWGDHRDGMLFSQICKDKFFTTHQTACSFSACSTEYSWVLQLWAYVEKGLKEFDGDSNRCRQGEEQTGLQEAAGAQAYRGYTCSYCPFFLINELTVAANLWSQAAVAATQSTQLLLGSRELPAAPGKEPPNQEKALFHKFCKQISCSYTDEAFQHYLCTYLIYITEKHQKTVSNFLLTDKHLQQQFYRWCLLVKVTPPPLYTQLNNWKLNPKKH